MDMYPDDPLLAVPEEKDKAPLTPETPALAVWNKIKPLDVAVPSPVDKDTAPPVRGSL
jgi:hypothetical protein